MSNKISAEILKAAQETYQLEVSLAGLSENALSKAIEAGVALYEGAYLESIAREAELYAEGCDGDHRDSLEWFADKLRQRLPEHSSAPYVPATDDIVEVVLNGPVHVYEALCKGCGEETEPRQWSVFDNTSQKEYFFEDGDQADMHIRVIERGQMV